MALINKLTAIGDAIRAKTGSSNKLTLDQMASEISNISTGGGEVPSFHFTGRQMQGLFIDGRLSQLHTIGYTTSDITDLSETYNSIVDNTINTPIINMKKTANYSLDCNSAFTNADLGTVNINFEGVAPRIKATAMFNQYKGKNINFIGVPNIECSPNGSPTAMFSGASNLKEIPQLNFVRYGSGNPLSFTYLFNDCINLKHRDDEIIIDYADFYNNNFTMVDCSSLFYRNMSMEKIPA